MCQGLGETEVWRLLTEEKPTFFTDPASCKYHHAQVGGLVEHSLGVFFNLVEWVSPKNLEDVRKLFRIAILHDVCKAGTYTVEMKSQKVKDADGNFVTGYNGKPMWEDVKGFGKKPFESPVLGHADASIIAALRAGITLTDDEIMCIRWHMGAYETQDSEGRARMADAIRLCPLVAITQTADVIDAQKPMELREIEARFNELASLFHVFDFGEVEDAPPNA
jgi:hypothetical protein